MCLARKRLNVLYAMISNHEYYREPEPPQPEQAAA